jgi:hypothetical protein
MRRKSAPPRMSGFLRCHEESSFVAGAPAALSSPQFPEATPVTVMIKSPSLYLLALTAAGAQAVEPAASPISLSQSPLVMRISKDEFRIVFGINGQQCVASGCHGRIDYRVNWRTEDGMTHSELKHINYTVPAHVGRSIAVDRQYFDTGEGQHTTEVVKVSVDGISYHPGAASL